MQIHQGKSKRVSLLRLYGRKNCLQGWVFKELLFCDGALKI